MKQEKFITWICGRCGKKINALHEDELKNNVQTHKVWCKGMKKNDTNRTTDK